MNESNIAPETTTSATGVVYWFTGLSGAGKTTIASLFYKKLTQVSPCSIFLDGDHLRETIADDLGYGSEDRLRAAMRYSRLCKLISDQGLNVVCATISMFHECREWNRGNIKLYKEFYIKVPIDALVQRDSKNIYSRALNNEITDVLGVDLEFEEPNNPDVVIENNETIAPSAIADKLFDAFSPNSPVAE